MPSSAIDVTDPRNAVRRWLEYLIIVAAGVAGYEMKKPFGLLLHQIMGIHDVPPQSITDWARNQAVQIVIVTVLATLVHARTSLPGAPALEHALYGWHRDTRIRIWMPGILGGLACLILGGLMHVVAARFGIQAPLAAKLNMSSLPHAVALKFALLYPPTAVGAALSEEVLYRFGALTIFVWLLSRLVPNSDKHASAILIVGLILQALLFGYAHVQEGIMHIPFGGLAMQVAIAPESWVALIFGFVFVRYGLEAAVVAHATADLINLAFFVAMALRHAH
jgi:Type II CAAX prenyl endopeptidase Rce1-like